MSKPMINLLQIQIIALSWFCLGFTVPASAQDGGEQFDITDILLSNYGGNSFVVSWRTSVPTGDNELLLGLAPDQLTTVLGDQLSSPGTLHFVQVEGPDVPQIDTTYYYKVRSGGVEAAAGAAVYDSIYIHQQSQVQLGAIIQGYVVDTRTGAPVKGAMIRSFYRWNRVSQSGTDVDSTMLYTVLTDADGKYVMNMGNYRKYSGTIAPYVSGGTWLHQVIMGHDQNLMPDSVLLPFTYNSSIEYILLDPYEIVSAVEPGDVDGNSSLNIFDLLELLKVLSGKITPEPWQQTASDIDVNGRVDIFDLLELLKKLKTVNTMSI